MHVRWEYFSSPALISLQIIVNAVNSNDCSVYSPHLFRQAAFVLIYFTHHLHLNANIEYCYK